MPDPVISFISMTLETCFDCVLENDGPYLMKDMNGTLFLQSRFPWKVMFQSELGAGHSAVWLRLQCGGNDFPGAGCPGAQMGAQAPDMGRPASCKCPKARPWLFSLRNTGLPSSSSHCLQNGHSRSARRREFICRRGSPKFTWLIHAD